MNVDRILQTMNEHEVHCQLAMDEPHRKQDRIATVRQVTADDTDDE